MKYIKKFEDLDDDYDYPEDWSPEVEIISYPEGNLINLTKDELEKLKNYFDFSWNDEVDYEEGIFGQWRYHTKDEEDIVGWLKIYRTTGDPDLYFDTKKFNI